MCRLFIRRTAGANSTETRPHVKLPSSPRRVPPLNSTTASCSVFSCCVTKLHPYPPMCKGRMPIARSCLPLFAQASTSIWRQPRGSHIRRFTALLAAAASAAMNHHPWILFECQACTVSCPLAHHVLIADGTATILPRRASNHQALPCDINAAVGDDCLSFTTAAGLV